MDKLSYALGMSMASSLLQSGLTDIDVESFAQAFKNDDKRGVAGDVATGGRSSHTCIF
jgi:hypothetical protein